MENLHGNSFTGKAASMARMNASATDGFGARKLVNKSTRDNLYSVPHHQKILSFNLNGEPAESESNRKMIS